MKRVLGISYVIGGIYLLMYTIESTVDGYIIESILLITTLFIWWIGLGPVEKKVNS